MLHSNHCLDLFPKNTVDILKYVIFLMYVHIHIKVKNHLTLICTPHNDSTDQELTKFRRKKSFNQQFALTLCIFLSTIENCTRLYENLYSCIQLSIVIAVKVIWMMCMCHWYFYTIWHESVTLLHWYLKSLLNTLRFHIQYLFQKSI